MFKPPLTLSLSISRPAVQANVQATVTPPSCVPCPAAQPTVQSSPTSLKAVIIPTPQTTIYLAVTSLTAEASQRATCCPVNYAGSYDIASQ